MGKLTHLLIWLLLAGLSVRADEISTRLNAVHAIVARLDRETDASLSELERDFKRTVSQKDTLVWSLNDIINSLDDLARRVDSLQVDALNWLDVTVGETVTRVDERLIARYSELKWNEQLSFMIPLTQCRISILKNRIALLKKYVNAPDPDESLIMNLLSEMDIERLRGHQQISVEEFLYWLYTYKETLEAIPFETPKKEFDISRWVIIIQEQIDHLEQLAENDTESLFHRAQKATGNEEKIRLYSRIIALDANRAEAYNNRGNAYRKLGRLSEALKDYSQAIEKSPLKASFWMNRGQVHRELGNEAVALADFDRYLSLNPDDASGYLMRGLTLRELEKYNEAIPDFTVVIRQNPKSTTALINRGICYRHLRKRQLAINDLLRAKQTLPQDLTVSYHLGCLYWDLKQWPEAIEAWTPYLRSDQGEQIRPWVEKAREMLNQ